jgi:hypothetical protein
VVDLRRTVEREDVLKILQRKVDATKRALSIATRAFDTMVREVPSGTFHADGVQRIKNASRRLSAAGEALNDAVARQSAYVLHGTLPGDLDRRTAERVRAWRCGCYPGLVAHVRALTKREKAN